MLRGSFSRSAVRRQRPCQGWLGEEQGPKGNGHTFESCRVRPEKRVPSVPGLWRAEIFEPRQLRHLLIRPPGDPAFELNGHATALLLKYFRFRGITDMLADIGPQCNPHCPRIVQELF